VKVALDVFHEGRNVLGIWCLLASGLRRDHLVDGCASSLRANVTKGIAPAGEAGIRRDLDEGHIKRSNGRGPLPEAGDAGVIGNADVVCPDVGDQHGIPLISGRS
jgi:hypothetical protein